MPLGDADLHGDADLDDHLDDFLTRVRIASGGSETMSSHPIDCLIAIVVTLTGVQSDA